jgi:SAM-dependent methyltransferase
MEQDENDQYYKKSPRRSWVTNQMGNPDYLPPELKSFRFLSVNLDQADYASLGQYDLVICSNVFEHLAKPDNFIAQCAQLLKPTGRLYLSWTNWFSPFGGHDFALFHYLGPRFGRWLHFKWTGKWSVHVPYAGLYITHIGRTLKLIRNTPGLEVAKMATRYYPEFTFVLRIPIVREFLAWNCALLISKQQTSPNVLKSTD